MRKLVFLAVACSVIGLVMLAFIPALQAGAGDMSIGDVSNSVVGRTVNLCGEVNSYRKTAQGHVFFKLKDASGDLQVVFFNSTARRVGEVYGLERGESVCVKGKVALYKEKLELIGSSVGYA